MNTFDWLAAFPKISKRNQILICGVLLALIAAIDWLAGPDISTSIFYLLPISLVTWYISQRTGLIFSVTSAVVWFTTDYFTNPDQTFWVIAFWNAIVRLGFFLIVVFSLATLRRSRQRQEDLVAFVVHDLRAPLGNVLVALEMLQGEVDEADGARHELTKVGLSSGQRMLNLIDSLLEWSKLENGQLKIDKDAVLVADLFAESVAQVVLTAEIKQVTIAERVEPPDLVVLADTSLTLRVLVNLLNNAIKFSPLGGIVTLKAKLGEGADVIITVHDQGMGIPVNWQQRVFAKYGQVTGGKSGGSGLGLAFCKLAIEAQDGRIWLESEAGHGTLFSLALPVTRNSAQTSREED